MNNSIEEKEFCSAVFLDVTQAFDKVWHIDLLYKIKQYLPYSYYNLLKSNLSDRHFLIKHNDIFTDLQSIKEYLKKMSSDLLFIYYLPATKDSTFASDTAITFHKNAVSASERLQKSLCKIQP